MVIKINIACYFFLKAFKATGTPNTNIVNKNFEKNQKICRKITNDENFVCFR